MYPQPIEDADRDRVIAELQRQHSAGFLDQATLAQRTETALRTEDSYQLEQLLADLPGAEGYAWTPDSHQQLAPYQATGQPQPNPAWPEQEPAWKTFLRNSKPWLVGMGVALLMAWIFIAPNGTGGMWWMIWIFFLFIRPALVTKQQRERYRNRQAFPPAGQQYPAINPPPPPPQYPPPITDTYQSDGRDGGQPGGWTQPPRS